jgi:hypothetical protein
MCLSLRAMVSFLERCSIWKVAKAGSGSEVTSSLGAVLGVASWGNSI